MLKPSNTGVAKAKGLSSPQKKGRGESSVKYCSQKFACNSEKQEAEFECHDCVNGKLQCLSCKNKLHERAKFDDHHVVSLLKPSPDILCSHVSCVTKRNFADFWCKDCGKQYCIDCSKQVHKAFSRKGHRVISFQEYIELSKQSSVSVLEKQKTESGVFHDTNEGDSPPPSFPSFSSTDEFMSFSDSAPVAKVSPVTPVVRERAKSPKPGGARRAMNYKDEPAVLDVASSSKPRPTPRSATKQVKSSPAASVTELSASLGASFDSISSREGADLENDIEMAMKSCEMETVNLYGRSQNDPRPYSESFLLVNEAELIQVKSGAELSQRLACPEGSLLKVLSIVGNTGDGKSHALNHTFFGGCEVFRTSTDSASCTAGVWAAYNKAHNVILVDTEGLLGITANQNQRKRLLLKVLAISDVVVFRTRAERLHTDLFNFMGDASHSYREYFASELQAAAKRRGAQLRLADMGPAAVVFHETQHTKPLNSKAELLQRFQELGLSVSAFRSVDYVGLQTANGQTDFLPFGNVAGELLRDFNVRAPRSPEVIYSLLQHLNDKFSGALPDVIERSFPEEYFTCRSICQACNCRCTRSMNHAGDHHSDGKCRYVADIDNKVFLCKKCDNDGRSVKMIPNTHSSKDSSLLGWAKFAFSGYVLECRNCGIVYRSREHWYGNEDPDKTVAKTEVRHAWPEGGAAGGGSHNAAQRLLDGVSSLGEAVSTYSAGPARVVSNFLTDRVRPDYWVADADITACCACKHQFTTRERFHHCRACGQGVCGDCSSRRRPVPDRGWPQPVRVCDLCATSEAALHDSTDSTSDDVTARMVTETLAGALGVMTSGMQLATGQVKASARPVYWVPDEQCVTCSACGEAFGARLSIHHCRACGRGVCDKCSQQRKPVTERGWQQPVRVCDACLPKLH